MEVDRWSWITREERDEILIWKREIWCDYMCTWLLNSDAVCTYTVPFILDSPIVHLVEIISCESASSLYLIPVSTHSSHWILLALQSGSYNQFLFLLSYSRCTYIYMYTPMHLTFLHRTVRYSCNRRIRAVIWSNGTSKREEGIRRRFLSGVFAWGTSRQLRYPTVVRTSSK